MQYLFISPKILILVSFFFFFKFSVIHCIFSSSLNSYFPHGLDVFALYHNFLIPGVFKKKNILIPGSLVFIFNEEVAKSTLCGVRLVTNRLYRRKIMWLFY